MEMWFFFYINAREEFIIFFSIPAHRIFISLSTESHDDEYSLESLAENIDSRAKILKALFV